MANYVDDARFNKARISLWSSLQQHLLTLYEKDRALTKSRDLSATFPFDVAQVDAEEYAVYSACRGALKDLLIDEVGQLNNLVKTIKNKGYREEDKNLLLIMVLGYMDVANSIFLGLELYKPFSKEVDSELEGAMERLDRLLKFVRLNIRGVMPKP